MGASAAPSLLAPQPLHPHVARAPRSMLVLGGQPDCGAAGFPPVGPRAGRPPGVAVAGHLMAWQAGHCLVKWSGGPV